MRGIKKRDEETAEDKRVTTREDYLVEIYKIDLN